MIRQSPRLLSVLATLIAGSAVTAGTPARADDLDPGAVPGWSFVFTTYGWGSWLKGQGGVAGRTFDVDVDPIDLIKHLDWDQIPVWMSYAEARRGRFSLFNDIVYAKVAGDGEFATTRRRRFSSLSLAGDVEADVEQATIELGAAYAVGQWGAPGATGFTAVDVLAGARYWHQEVDLAVDVTAKLNVLGLTVSGNRAFAHSGSVDWVDPFVGLRLRHQLSAGEEIVLRGDVGGFDAGSNFSWQALATYGWKICNFNGLEMDGYIGYRALSVDYEQGSGLRRYEYDVIQHGPVMGMTTRF